MTNTTQARVIALSISPQHTMHKFARPSVMLIEGIGVEGDAHAGEKVKHRSRVAKNPDQPNLRQVHLVAQELIEQLQKDGFPVVAGIMGENITTQGIDLLALPENTTLVFGSAATIKITGLRNPCAQLDGIKPGLMKAVLDTDEEGNLIRKAGVMATVIAGGVINVGDPISIVFPPEPHQRLKPV